MRARTALSVALLVVLSATLPVVAAPVGGASPVVDARAGSALVPATGPQDATGAAVGAVEDERTVRLEIQLRPSGDADWTVTTYVPLQGEDDREAFEELGRDYVNGTADVEVDADTFRRYVAAASAASDRTMRLPDASVARDWTIENGTGELQLRFTWTGFAREAGDRLVVDDAFQTDSGTWLPRLAEGQVLVIRPPEDAGFVETPRGKGVTDGRLRWEGPQEFESDYFYIEYQADVATPPDTVTPPVTEPPGGPLDLPAGAYLLFAVLVGGGAAAYLWRRRRPGDEGPTPAAAADHPGDGTDPAEGAAAASGASGMDADSGAEGEGASAGDGDGGEAASEPTPEDPFAGVDLEMLSDEERVLRLLDANGGRMKQARIVSETDWSNAKVSQLLSAMDDDDEIDKLRIGRENLISRPDVDVESFEE